MTASGLSHKKNVRVYIHPNPEIRSFLTTSDIYPLRVDHYKKPFDSEKEVIAENLGYKDAQLIRDLMSIPGISEISVKPKEIRVTKDTSCSWDKIESHLIKSIERALRRKEFKAVHGKKHN